ncbi:uncharacterized protein LOC125233572 [Leguminivora glycinivorella]|uniref:uncharacterized protein LOC125233572 n=1 Tax=Leguminivora glycinivorella TaxID=1035111 RepID=UPI00200D989B|nr:uncharacterized protein LOC125233572 [Leguminivora glycinivorella]
MSDPTAIGIDLFDLSHPVRWKDMQNVYLEIAAQTQWQVCYNCGFPEMGTSIHYQYHGWNAMKPAAIPLNNLLTRLIVIDVSSLAKSDPNLVLSLDDARRFLSVENGPFRPTILLFKFGWHDHPSYGLDFKCFCQIPGISFDLAAWIAVQLSHVVGVATDAPSLESEETRNATAKTVSALFGKSGVFMIENVDARRGRDNTDPVIPGTLTGRQRVPEGENVARQNNITRERADPNTFSLAHHYLSRSADRSTRAGVKNSERRGERGRRGNRNKRRRAAADQSFSS